MFRTALLVLAIAATTATAIASIAPTTTASHSANITVIAKNQAFPQFGPFEVDECAVEDCSEE
jgi:hypothetical protein